MSIGEKLGKSLAEIRNLPASEITLWVAYFKIKDKKPDEENKSDLEGFKNLMRV